MYSCLVVLITLSENAPDLSRRLIKHEKPERKRAILIENHEQTHLVDSSGQEICARREPPSNRISQGI